MQRLGTSRAIARNRSNRRLVKIRRRIHRRPLPPVALRDGILYVCLLEPALEYGLEQVSKIEILRKLKRRFGSKTIGDVRFRVR